MIAFLKSHRAGPIGVDLGSRSVKLVQLSGDRSRVIDAVRWDLPNDLPATPEERSARWTSALRQALEGRKFVGRDAVLTLGVRELFVQNLRVPKSGQEDLAPVVRRESEDRLPYPASETELRFIEAADVRQGESVRREVIVLACHRPVLHRLLQTAVEAGLKPIAVDVEPLAMLRCYVSQFRRGDDLTQRVMYVHIGQANTVVLIAQGEEVLFVKYIEVGGQHFDDAVSRYLQMTPAEAWALRRHNGDRRAEQQDPEIARSVGEAVRPVVERLANEISLCIRYHSVTFRGQPLVRLILGGGEATPQLVERISARLDMRSELGDPFRSFPQVQPPGRLGQWDIALGLSLRTAHHKPQLAGKP